jgi:osmotically inducible protein OsmC
MLLRKANAVWEGDLKGGKGVMQFPGFEGPYTFLSRFEEGKGTNPEVLLGAAHAGCYSMALSGALAKAGFTPIKIETVATVKMAMDNGPKISEVHLDCSAEVTGIEPQRFQQIAEDTKINCPISIALKAVEITLEARLV